MQFLFIEALVLAALAAASPTSVRATHHVTHEKRQRLPVGWEKRERVDGSAVLPLRIGLKQNNLDRADELLDEVSNPKSAKYAQHWTPREIVDMFAPSKESVDSVSSWLAESGIEPSRIVVSPSKSWINVNATVAEVESLIKTQYHVYEHSSGHLHVASDTYSVPAYLSTEHIDIIMPTLHFDVKVKPGQTGSGDELRKRRLETRKSKSSRARALGQGPSTHSKLGPQFQLSSIVEGLQDCDKLTVPKCLRALYGIPQGSSAQPGNTYGITEYAPETYHMSDMDLFFSNFSKAQVGDRPILNSIDGGSQPQNTTDVSYLYESSLDLQYAMALVYPQNVTVYQVGDRVQGASFNNFLDALDGSYCNYEGGDDPSQDAPYPDPFPGGYKGPADCGTTKATNVISSSYGYDEAVLTPAYQMRQCYEYMKLGLQGVTFLYSSGDYGVAGNGNTCLGPNNTFIGGSSGRFNPGFPGSCPYITSVGATQVPTGTDISKALASKVQPEVACETKIYSGGGFSNVFPLPSYQSDAVSQYLKTSPPPYGADQYNNTGRTRGFPDVAANGANYAIAVLGTFRKVYGTSAASPTFGAVVTLINEQRLARGKAPVGFLNPTLYAHPEVLNDVTQGANRGCGTAGFAAAPGWDPVTGLGTPNFEKMLDLFLSLP